jgi:hypothetical protein
MKSTKVGANQRLQKTISHQSLSKKSKHKKDCICWASIGPWDHFLVIEFYNLEFTSAYSKEHLTWQSFIRPWENTTYHHSISLWRLNADQILCFHAFIRYSVNWGPLEIRYFTISACHCNFKNGIATWIKLMHMSNFTDNLPHCSKHVCQVQKQYMHIYK